MSSPAPTWWLIPEVWASSTASPFTVADRSITTKSSFAAGRCTPVSVPKRAWSPFSWSSTSASVTSAASTDTEIVEKSGSSIEGRTSTSAVKAILSPSSIEVTSISG